ncbi:MAG: succinylglutamate desuccinylase/aspartoacylase family protein [Myxococcales bacterium]|nr:succinylglutamate desuccinylase/aspartoacylase family protein [Myxococcales bacterium]MDH5307889.1 succinylglutamate desuccinylase/aspartoacylase family protein [Myxococcales bacterium]MDH5566018.1 succinylglutamate desuccinylase/aspartoacylase family protein [Myxococcales bacterium]
MNRASNSESFEIGGVEVAPGQGAVIDLPVASDYGHGEVVLPLQVVRGRRPGPQLFLSAALHGDEINGVEIVRRLLRRPRLTSLRGILIAVPVVNVYGFITQSRYLPDRRDLNRSFPGAAKGSLTSRLAHCFHREVLERCTHGIDLHTGSQHRANLPQVRAYLAEPEVERMARSFGTPVILDAKMRPGSLRQVAQERGVPVLTYEAGEALRFDELAIRAGVRGILSVMRSIGMLPNTPRLAKLAEPYIAHSSSWARAPEGGLLRAEVGLGQSVEEGTVLGRIAGLLGEGEVTVRATVSGVVIGLTRLPLVNTGDALFHIASVQEPEAAAEQVEYYRDALAPDDPEWR